MPGLLRKAFKIIFDFENDVTDLAERLDRAERTEKRLQGEIQDLHDEIVRLRQENQRLRAENEGLKREPGDPK